jgi:hypothetical protein
VSCSATRSELQGLESGTRGGVLLRDCVLKLEKEHAAQAAAAEQRRRARVGEVPCQHCGGMMQVRQHNSVGRRRFCSAACIRAGLGLPEEFSALFGAAAHTLTPEQEATLAAADRQLLAAALQSGEAAQ